MEGAWVAMPESQTEALLKDNPTLYENEGVLKGLSVLEIEFSKENATFTFPETDTAEELAYRVESQNVLYIKAPGVPESRMELTKDNQLMVEIYIDRPPSPPHILKFVRK